MSTKTIALLAPQGTNSAEGLRDLHIHHTLDIDLAWGWWLLLILSVIVVPAILLYYHKNRQKKAYKQYVKQYFKQALTQVQLADNTIIEISLLLRQFCLMFFSDESVKSLSNQAWVNFLDSKKPLNSTLKKLLQESAYQADLSTIKTEDIEALINYASEFINV